MLLENVRALVMAGLGRRSQDDGHGRCSCARGCWEACCAPSCCAHSWAVQAQHLLHLYPQSACPHWALKRGTLSHAQVGQEGLMRSRARRWARVMDEATWPEVLRRYLLVSRAALPRPDQAAAPDQAPEAAALLDDDAASVRFAGLLAERPFYECA